MIAYIGFKVVSIGVKRLVAEGEYRLSISNRHLRDVLGVIERLVYAPRLNGSRGFRGDDRLKVRFCLGELSAIQYSHPPPLVAFCGRVLCSPLA